jgi:hypothetical protein
MCGNCAVFRPSIARPRRARPQRRPGPTRCRRTPRRTRRGEGAATRTARAAPGPRSRQSGCRAATPRRACGRERQPATASAIADRNASSAGRTRPFSARVREAAREILLRELEMAMTADRLTQPALGSGVLGQDRRERTHVGRCARAPAPAARRPPARASPATRDCSGRARRPAFAASNAACGNDEAPSRMASARGRPGASARTRNAPTAPARCSGSPCDLRCRQTSRPPLVPGRRWNVRAILDGAQIATEIEPIANRRAPLRTLVKPSPRQSASEIATTSADELLSPAARGRSEANDTSAPSEAPGKLRASRRATTAT